MENGLQTHLVPNEENKRLLTAKKMGFRLLEDFDRRLNLHTVNVHQIFKRIFSEKSSEISPETLHFEQAKIDISNLESEISASSVSNPPKVLQNLLSSLKKSDLEINLSRKQLFVLQKLAEVSPVFIEMLVANPMLINYLPSPDASVSVPCYQDFFSSEVFKEKDFAQQIAILRKIWARFLLEIVVFDVLGNISLSEAKRLQTELAEASLETAVGITRRELEKRFSVKPDFFSFGVLGLGKLGGKGLDYGSDLDLILIYDEEQPVSQETENIGVFYAKAVEIFVTTLSAMTREGSLYRVDLRLRPDGKNGPTCIGKTSFLNYLQERAAIWEWLAYIKIRGVSGDLNLADSTVQKARQIIHQNALKVDKDELKTETRRIRERLQKQKAGKLKSREIDIKFGEGGMLDVYFAMRYLQLRDNIPDDLKDRSTSFMLRKLYENKSLSTEDFKNLAEGYSFLSELDHQLRLTIGRSTRLPIANQNALQIISKRLKLDSPDYLLERLTFHRLNIRHSFENILQCDSLQSY
jgi:glutamate-ammonia-ligase adenylyltransferase